MIRVKVAGFDFHESQTKIADRGSDIFDHRPLIAATCTQLDNSISNQVVRRSGFGDDAIGDRSRIACAVSQSLFQRLQTRILRCLGSLGHGISFQRKRGGLFSTACEVSLVRLEECLVLGGQ